ncbi:MAG: HNH endonuclease [Bacteroidales bacterium]|nr:HNH endonuclease [Candidatus Latescibacterota bacterium]
MKKNDSKSYGGECAMNSILFVRAGHKNELADEFLSLGIVAVGWKKLADLSSIKSEGELERLLIEAYPKEGVKKDGSVKKHYAEIIEFSITAKPGDHVVTVDSVNKRLIVGVIEGPYKYTSEKYLWSGGEPYRHTLPVSWKYAVARTKEEKHSFPETALVGKTTYWLSDDTVEAILKAPRLILENHVQVKKLRNPRYWWVNQNQTYKHEVEGGYLWSPKLKKNGHRSHSYDNMTKVSPGDIVFSFKGARIPAIGIIQSKAVGSDKPMEFGQSGENWDKDGWYVSVEYHELKKKIRPKDHIDLIIPTLPDKYSPLQKTGDGIQNTYLAEIPKEMAGALVNLIGPEADEIVQGLRYESLQNITDDEIENDIRISDTITNTEKEQMVKSRRGQGVFRTRLESIEDRCRITGITQKHHLRASHIKPWRDSNNKERLDGENGLLLSPHVDHLFDRGFISFKDDGTVLLAEKLDQSVLDRWSIELPMNVGSFSTGQKRYLDYHRGNIFNQ